MDWDELALRLSRALRDVRERCYLIVAAGPYAYVQLHGTAEVLFAEGSGRLGQGEDAEAGMRAAGWVSPTAGQPNYTATLPLPATTDELQALARACVTALRDVAGISSPAALTYRAWREPDAQPPGVTWSPDRLAELDPGQDPLLLPELGLPIEGQA